MKVLVTGGTGVVGTAAVTALLARGHTVRLLSRHADADAKQWPEGVEPCKGSIAEADDVRGSAEGCDAVLHCAGIVDESPPEVTFDRVNVGGTRLLVEEAERAGVPHFVYVSSLGCDRGESPYHKSKLEGERIVRGFDGRWVITRPGNVYGPGDEVVSLMLRLVRTLPAVPVVGGGDQPFQPIWVEDLAPALAAACERSDLAGRTLELAGGETTNQRDLFERLARITGRSPAQLPLPGALASLGQRLASMVGIDLPVNQSQLQMLEEENVVRDPAGNALVTVFDIEPIALDEGLRRLADAQPEQLPDEGVGKLTRKRFWTDIVGSPYSAEALFDRIRHRFGEITPWHLDTNAEPGTPNVPEQGATLTMNIPMRGNIQVRVEDLGPRHMTFVTLAGHPLAGAIRFATSKGADGRLRFQIDVWDKSANFVDWIAMSTIGGRMQDSTWVDTVQSVIDESGGEAPAGVEHESRSLDGEAEEGVTEWLQELVVERKREANADVLAETPYALEPTETDSTRARNSADVPRPN